MHPSGKYITLAIQPQSRNTYYVIKTHFHIKTALSI